MVQEKGFDESVLDKFMDLGGADFIVKMIDLFIKNASNRIAEAQAGEQAGDLPAIQRAVHSLQSSAGNFGSNRLIALSRQIESCAIEHKADEIPSLLAELETYFHLVKTNLELAKQRFEL